MAKRQSVFKADSTDVQGEGSWVTLRRLTWGEVKDNLKRTKGTNDQDVDSVELSVEMVLSHVVDWNWVDDDGNALPLLKDDAELGDKLILEELTFLTNQLVGNFRRG